MTTRNPPTGRLRLAAFVLLPLSLVGIQAQPVSAQAESAEFAGAATWTGQPSLRTARALHGVAAVDGRIFVFGGYDPDPERILGSVEVSPARPGGGWRYSTPEPRPRANANAAEVRGLVYLVGGEDLEHPDVPQDLVDRFDPRSGTWKASVPLPEGRVAAGVASLGGLLYVAGGFVTADEVTASVVVFDPARRAWRSVAPMPTPRARLKMVAADGRLYAIGGLTAQFASLSTVERYDPGSDTWTTVASLAEQRAQPGVVAVEHGGRTLVVAVGGARTAGAEPVVFSRTTEVFEPRTGRWRTLTALLPRGKAGLSCVTRPDGTVLAIGGATPDSGSFDATSDVYALKLTGRR